MYVNPRRAEILGHQDAPPAAPESAGHRLATLLRGPGAEVRISLDEFKGARFVLIRLWEGGVAGWFPSRKGITIRLRELGDVIEAFQEAETPPTAPAPSPRRRDARDPSPKLPLTEGPANDDEPFRSRPGCVVAPPFLHASARRDWAGPSRGRRLDGT